MTDPCDDMLACLQSEPWRPQSLRHQPDRWPDAHWRLAGLVGIGLLHLLVAGWLIGEGNRDQQSDDQVLMLLDFSVPAHLPRAPDVPPLDPLPDPLPNRATSLAEPTPALPTRRKPRRVAAVPLQVMPEPETRAVPSEPGPVAGSPPIELYDADGRVIVPDDLLDQIDRKLGDKRVFSYQVPRMDDARKLFYRNPPVAYEATRFDEYWAPDQDALTALLTKLAEKTTKEIRIPMPGRPDSAVICKISLLALGGGCGVLTNGADYVGPLDDPSTLTPEEDRQCQAWWEKIVSANTQDVWRKTRDLYEAECRKPRERPTRG